MEGQPTGPASGEKRQGVDAAIAEHVEYDVGTECLLWTGALHPTGRFPVLDPGGVSLPAYLFRGLPGARRPGFTTLWGSTCGNGRCLSWLHAEVRGYHPHRD